MKKSTKVWSSAAAAAALFAVPACSGGGGGDAGGSGDPLVVGMLMAFSGPTAVEGAEVVNGCLPAAAEINEAGGVLGRDIECEAFDTKGTASDSVPAARQMLSTTSNLFTVLGPSTAEAAAAAPVLEEAGQVMFSPAGDGRFDRTELDYYYRLITSDTVARRRWRCTPSSRDSTRWPWSSSAARLRRRTSRRWKRHSAAWASASPKR
ncbi:ABC transporter substrate-binding protein [Mycolicibacterium vaccae]|nr:ABC transporter substrate-binding protein [Mycolicibacterium vaccae]